LKVVERRKKVLLMGTWEERETGYSILQCPERQTHDVATRKENEGKS